MNSDKTIFEKMGGSYEEKDGLLYPMLALDKGQQVTFFTGKCGHLWIEYLKENEPARYRELVFSGRIRKRAAAVNEEAYEMLDSIMEQYMKKNPPIKPSSTMEMWRLREQVKQVAEETIYHDIIYKL